MKMTSAPLLTLIVTLIYKLNVNDQNSVKMQ